MEELHDGRLPPGASQHRAREKIAPSSRKLSSRVAVAAFAGILVFYLTTLQSTWKTIGEIHHAPSIIITNSTAADLAVVGDGGRDDVGNDDLRAESLAADAAGSAPDRFDGGHGTQSAWPTKKPNEGRTDEGSVGVRADTGIRSPHYGDIQRHHQEWLIRKAQQLSLRLGINEHSAAEGSKSSLAEGVGGGGSTTTKLSSFEEKPEPPTKRDGSAAAAVGRKTQEVGLKAQEVEERQRLLRGAEGTAAVERTELEDRIDRANIGVRLWGETYVPPIEPERRQELIDKWTGTTWSMPENAAQAGQSKSKTRTKAPMGRILYVISSFDRGERLGKKFRQQSDKMDFVLMMLDEMREACEVGFSPEVHFLAAWDPSVVVHLVRDRLFCERTGENVPFSFQEYPHSVGNKLSAKHRIYMKDRLELFDVFLQVEDDMLLTLNHILLYLEESELLDNRMYVAVTRILRQGLWVATREQLRKLSEAPRCRYLDFDEGTAKGQPETHSGSIQMFSKECGFDKVFPATHFEDFLVHHRANNKAGLRGESIPGVPIRLLREWVEQFIRDEGLLKPKN